MLVVTGLAVGWRVYNGPADALAAVGLSLLFAFAMTWAGACAGMVLRSPEAAQAIGFILFLPLASCPTRSSRPRVCPAWLRDFANWNPMSALAGRLPRLVRRPQPGHSSRLADAASRELAVVVWSVALIAIFAPTAVPLYRRKVLR